jgi:pilus assembly protein FimV
VGEFKLNKWVAAGLMLSMPYAGVADAAGLGRMNVLSQLGQPFAAEIDLVNVSKEELATLKANLAPPAAYQASNLQFNPALNALRLSVERRANGNPYVKATSFRPVSEPYLDLLIELSWQGGKIVREYSALLDPPGMQAPAPAVTAPVVAAPAVAPPPPAPAAEAAPASPPPAAASAPAPAAPARAARAPVARAPARAAPAAPVAPAAPAARASQYAVRQGDTLSGIARSVRPEGISLEQTLMGLYRANPDAFSNKNINQLHAGKILNVPEREQLAAIEQGSAAQEVRVHASNWNNYRRTVAGAAPASMGDFPPAAKGKIAARVDDKAAPAGPRDVVVLSKGDTGSSNAGTGKDGKSGADRLRAMEEDLAARDKALAESKDRIAQLEKTLKDMQKLAEIKNPSMAAAQQAAKGADAKADAKVDTKAQPVVAKAEPAKVEPAKAEPAKVEPAKVEPKVEVKAPDAPKVDTPPAPKPPAPAPKKASVPPPPPEPGLMDTVMDNIVPIGGGAAVLLAGLGGFWALRRRKQNAMEDDEPVAPSFKSAEPFRGNVAPSQADATLPPTSTSAFSPAVMEPTVSSVSDTVDPIDEAQVYIDHGRDTQAEEILKEAMAQHPSREDIPLKLLEVYAARGDKAAFNSVAKDFHKSTGGIGDKWGRAAVMGFALDPGNALYPSTGEVVDLAATRDSSGAIDLDLSANAADPLGTTTDILLEHDHAGAPDMDKTMVLSRGSVDSVDMDKTMALSVDAPPITHLDAHAPAASLAPAAATALPDFNIEFPMDSAPAVPAAPVAPLAAAPVAPAASNMLEFNIDLPTTTPLSTTAAPLAAPAPAAKAADAPLDFKIDFSGIDLNLDEKAPAAPAAAPAAAAVSGAKDAQWEDVQQKFDLARAYQEMGDKEGAVEILQEVEREGDAAQIAEAKKMLQTLK